MIRKHLNLLGEEEEGAKQAQRDCGGIIPRQAQDCRHLRDHLGGGGLRGSPVLSLKVEPFHIKWSNSRYT